MTNYFTTPERIESLQLELKRWEGTPWKMRTSPRQVAELGIGCDCTNVLAEVFENLGLHGRSMLPPVINMQSLVSPNENFRMLTVPLEKAVCKKRMAKIDRASESSKCITENELLEGDVMLFQFPKNIVSIGCYYGNDLCYMGKPESGFDRFGIRNNRIMIFLTTIYRFLEGADK